MKKTLSIVVLLLLASTISFGQFGIGINKGIKGGLNLATVGGSDAASGLKANTGYAAGIFIEINLPGPISIQPEALYSIKGFKSPEDPIIGTTTVTTSYIDIPVLVKFSLPIPIISPSIFAGPSMGFLMSAKRKDEAPINHAATETDVKENFSKTDLGLVVGVGLNLSILSVDARYSIGLTKLNKDGNAKTYNRVIGLYIGIEL